MTILQRLGVALTALGASAGAFAQNPPTASVSYGLAAAPIPVFGWGSALIMGLCLAALGAWWLKREPGALRSIAAAVMATGVLAAAASGGWMVSNAQAVVASVEFLFSENDSPVTVAEFPATLVNDLPLGRTIKGIDVTGCPAEVEIVGTCQPGTTLAAEGGSCMIESVCAAAPPPADAPQACTTGNDATSGDPWTVCFANSSEAWVSHDTGGGTYNATEICQSLGYDDAARTPDTFGGTCGDVCGYCQSEVTSCSSPGNRTYDGNGLNSNDANGLVLSQTVHWTCVNDPN